MIEVLEEVRKKFGCCGEILDPTSNTFYWFDNLGVVRAKGTMHGGTLHVEACHRCLEAAAGPDGMQEPCQPIVKKVRTTS